MPKEITEFRTIRPEEVNITVFTYELATGLTGSCPEHQDRVTRSEGEKNIDTVTRYAVQKWGHRCDGWTVEQVENDIFDIRHTDGDPLAQVVVC